MYVQKSRVWPKQLFINKFKQMIPNDTSGSFLQGWVYCLDVPGGGEKKNCTHAHTHAPISWASPRDLMTSLPLPSWNSNPCCSPLAHDCHPHGNLTSSCFFSGLAEQDTRLPVLLKKWCFQQELELNLDIWNTVLQVKETQRTIPLFELRSLHASLSLPQNPEVSVECKQLGLH